MNIEAHANVLEHTGNMAHYIISSHSMEASNEMLEEAKMNLGERVSQLNETDLTISLITTLEECDIPKIPSMAKTEMKKIGFVIST